MPLIETPIATWRACGCDGQVTRVTVEYKCPVYAFIELDRSNEDGGYVNRVSYATGDMPALDMTCSDCGGSIVDADLRNRALNVAESVSWPSWES